MAIRTFTVNLLPSEEVPPVTTAPSATGVAEISIDTRTNSLHYNITLTGLSSAETGAHIHGMAAAGSNASVLHALPSGNTKSGVWVYSSAQELDVLNGLTYINVHTQNNPNGEIRGQITIPASTWTSLVSLPADCWWWFWIIMIAFLVFLIIMVVVRW